MLANAHVTTILPVVQLERAREFYSQKLGLKEIGRGPKGEFLYNCAGSHVALVPRGPTHSTHTALSFEVDELENMVKTLTKKGVTFENYDLPDLKTINGVCVLGAEKAAWFKDTEGNILCLHQQLGH